MSKVYVDITMSLDGYIAGPNDNPEQGLGEGGERLHEWIYGLESWRATHNLEGGEKNQDSEILAEAFANTGAVLMGRNMFDFAEEAWGANPPFHAPVFIVTHRSREPLVKEGGTTFTFVTDGLDSAVAQAKAAAGDKDISAAGGASLIQQLLTAGQLDEIQIHVTPLLLGAGRRLFDNMEARPIEMEIDRVVASPVATHLRYRVVKE
jgi:dihydrofolate reductase